MHMSSHMAVFGLCGGMFTGATKRLDAARVSAKLAAVVMASCLANLCS